MYIERERERNIISYHIIITTIDMCTALNITTMIIITMNIMYGS